MWKTFPKATDISYIADKNEKKESMYKQKKKVQNAHDLWYLH